MIVAILREEAMVEPAKYIKCKLLRLYINRKPFESLIEWLFSMAIEIVCIVCAIIRFVSLQTILPLWYSDIIDLYQSWEYKTRYNK